MQWSQQAESWRFRPQLWAQQLWAAGPWRHHKLKCSGGGGWIGGRGERCCWRGSRLETGPAIASCRSLSRLLKLLAGKVRAFPAFDSISSPNSPARNMAPRSSAPARWRAFAATRPRSRGWLDRGHTDRCLKAMYAEAKRRRETADYDEDRRARYRTTKRHRQHKRHRAEAAALQLPPPKRRRSATALSPRPQPLAAMAAPSTQVDSLTCDRLGDAFQASIPQLRTAGQNARLFALACDDAVAAAAAASQIAAILASTKTSGFPSAAAAAAAAAARKATCRARKKAKLAAQLKQATAAASTAGRPRRSTAGRPPLRLEDEPLYGTAAASKWCSSVSASASASASPPPSAASDYDGYSDSASCCDCNESDSASATSSPFSTCSSLGGGSPPPLVLCGESDHEEPEPVRRRLSPSRKMTHQRRRGVHTGRRRSKASRGHGGGHLGCSKCRFSARGCTRCRRLAASAAAALCARG